MTRADHACETVGKPEFCAREKNKNRMDEKFSLIMIPGTGDTGCFCIGSGIRPSYVLFQWARSMRKFSYYISCYSRFYFMQEL